MECENDNTEACWYAMRDLSRRHAKVPAYKLLREMEFKVFTPMCRKVVVAKGQHHSIEVPFIQDLLFVHAVRERLDAAVAKITNLQYRYIHGGYCQPMVVPSRDMDRFISAVESSHQPKFFSPNEITPEMYGKYVRIVGGTLDGYEGHLLSMRGSKYKRLLVELPNCLTAAIEVQPDLIEVLE